MEIPLDRIEPNPWNPRTDFEDSPMQELVDSIKRFGVLQPILVRPHPTKKGKYQIIYGQRRWTACTRVGLESIPVREPVTPVSDKDAVDMMGDENIKRQAYTPMELARYFEIRNKVFGESTKELAHRYEVDHSTVADIMNLHKLPEELKPKVTWGTPTFVGDIGTKPAPEVITFSKAHEILKLPDRKKQLEIARKIESSGLSIAQVKKEVRKELGIERNETSLPPLSEQMHGKVMWNLSRIDLKPYQYFTVGYSERDLEQLIKVLKTAGVKTLVDVRYEPFSIHKPEFNKESLEKALNKNGILYRHFLELGVPKEIRLKLAKTGDYNWLFEWYDKNIIPELDEAGFDALKRPFAVMCVELDPTKCHRHRIALALEKKGLKGFDL